MTPARDAPRGRPRNGSREAMLDRLRAKGFGLAPVVSKPSINLPAAGGVLGASVADRGVRRPITHEDPVRPAEGRTAPGTVFEFEILAPCEFLNANRDTGHWTGKAPKIRAWRRAGADAAAAVGLPRGLARVQVDCFVIKPILNAYDPANWAPTAKACLDGMVSDYGLTEDDNRRFVTGPFMHEGGRGADALLVRITVLDMS